MQYIYPRDIWEWIKRKVCDHRWITAIAAVVYTIGALCTLSEIKNGNEINRRNNVLNNRPNIVMTDLSLFQTPQEIAVIPRWENTGNIAAHITAQVNWVFSRDPAPDNFFLVPAATKYKDSIGPKAVSSAVYAALPLACVSNMKDQHIFRYANVWGSAEYRDSLSDKERVTRFCWNILGGINSEGGSTGTATHFLHAMCDDDCKAYDNIQPPTLPQDFCVATVIIPNIPIQQNTPTPILPSAPATPPAPQ
jgi:hypothetical protein